jgi:hypothetical protein
MQAGEAWKRSKKCNSEFFLYSLESIKIYHDPKFQGLGPFISSK